MDVKSALSTLVAAIDGQTEDLGSIIANSRKAMLHRAIADARAALAAPAPQPEMTEADILDIAKNPMTAPCSPWWLKDETMLGDVKNAAVVFARAVIARDREKRSPSAGDAITEAMWGGLARDIMMAWDMGCKTPRKIFEALENLGRPIPAWLRDEPEMKALDSVPSKGTRCVLIYKAMREAAGKTAAPSVGQRKPLTKEQIEDLMPSPDGTAEVNVVRLEVLPGVMGTEYEEADAWSLPLVVQAIRDVEAAHGITAAPEGQQS